MPGVDITDAPSKTVVILLAYSDADRCGTLVRWLTDAVSNEVVTCSVARAVSGLAEDAQPDVILLEESSDSDALLLACEEIRQVTDRPVVVLSELSDEFTITRALEAGIDEYLVSPIGEGEFIARVKALSRRWGNGGQPRSLRFGGLVLSPEAQAAGLRGRVIDLAPIEFRLLACLVAAQGNVVTHDYLMANVWGAEYVDSRHYLHLYIRYLREKLEDNPKTPQLILSEWGIGYRLQPALSAEPL